jgi:hypothetical protein
MFSNSEKSIRNNLLNIPGWRTTRKLVVRDSDDWGSIRMPSLEVYEELLSRGYHPGRDPYLKYDSLATGEDLQLLFGILRSVRDSRGNPAVLTANCVMQNPDFERIEEGGFEQYHPELFTETHKRYKGCENSIQLWREGMKQGLFRPQFHGREHLNVTRWMKALKEEDALIHEAFKLRMISISSMLGEKMFNYMEALDYFNEEERLEKAGIVEVGLNLFAETFGYRSDTFIANNYVWETPLEEVMVKNKVRCIKGIANQFQPVNRKGEHYYRYVNHFTGQKSRYGLRHLIRNAFFEPSISGAPDDVGECLRRIRIAFRWGKPAIISTHRLNYTGAIDPANRDHNLRSLKELLTRITVDWPDAEFVTSDQLCGMMSDPSR